MCRLNHHRASFNKQIETFTLQSTTQVANGFFCLPVGIKIGSGENGNLAENLFARFSDSLAECWQGWPEEPRPELQDFIKSTCTQIHLHLYNYNYTITITQIQRHNTADKKQNCEASLKLHTPTFIGHRERRRRDENTNLVGSRYDRSWVCCNVRSSISWKQNHLLKTLWFAENTGISWKLILLPRN